MLPTDAQARKDIPIYSGFIKYFPDAIAAVAALSKKGNDQHNPGKPLHWDRSKSADEMDAQMRHVLDMAGGTEADTDGVLHATKNAWRAMANLQKLLEAKRQVAEAEVEARRGYGLPPVAPARATRWLMWSDRYGYWATLSKYTPAELYVFDGTPVIRIEE